MVPVATRGAGAGDHTDRGEAGGKTQKSRQHYKAQVVFFSDATDNP